MKYGPEYGARILDRYMPGWWNCINLTKFDIESGTNCIAGQLFNCFRNEYQATGYCWFLDRMPEKNPNQDVSFGFDSDNPEDQGLWIALIKSRRQSN